MNRVPDPAALRQGEFAALGSERIFLNSASVGPMPSRALAALEAGNRDRGAPWLWPVERMNEIHGRSRSLAASLIGAAPDTIALMPNTTTGLNIAARALPLSRGDVVVTFDREFPSVVYPWLMRSAEGIVLERIPADGRGWPDEERLLERLHDAEVKAACISLTQFSNGYTVDLGRISRITRSLGKWLIVDAIQAGGQVPIDLAGTPVDFLACGMQKWLLSPWGTGFLHVRRELVEEFAPTFAGWAAFQGTDDYSRLTAYDTRPWNDARRFELITLATQDFAAANESLSLILGIGVERIAAHLEELRRPVEEWAAAGRGVITSPVGGNGSGIVCIRPHGDVGAAYRALLERGVACALREGSIRLSPHLFNTVDEMERVLGC